MGVRPLVHVVAAAIVRGNEVLVAVRPSDRHFGGYWEFPGGKVEPGESRESALMRELTEELGIKPTRASPLICVPFEYPEKCVRLDVWRVDRWEGEPHGAEGQQVVWRPIHALVPDEFPPANATVISALKLPAEYKITPDLSGHADTGFDFLCRNLASGGRQLVQLRTKTDADRLAILIERLNQHPKRSDWTLILNSGNAGAGLAGCDGVHLTATHLMGASSRPEQRWVSASCHNRSELDKAVALGLDFAVLSPVQATATHPESKPMGWEAFGELVAPVPIPVFALGGLDRGDLGKAQCHGAQGVAGIRAFWT